VKEQVYCYDENIHLSVKLVFEEGFKSFIVIGVIGIIGGSGGFSSLDNNAIIVIIGILDEFGIVEELFNAINGIVRLVVLGFADFDGFIGFVLAIPVQEADKDCPHTDNIAIFVGVAGNGFIKLVVIEGNANFPHFRAVGRIADDRTGCAQAKEVVAHEGVEGKGFEKGFCRHIVLQGLKAPLLRRTGKERV